MWNKLKNTYIFTNYFNFPLLFSWCWILNQILLHFLQYLNNIYEFRCSSEEQTTHCSKQNIRSFSFRINYHYFWLVTFFSINVYCHKQIDKIFIFFENIIFWGLVKCKNKKKAKKEIGNHRKRQKCYCLFSQVLKFNSPSTCVFSCGI